MLKLYDFECSNGHIVEHLMESEDAPRRLTCECGAESERLISMPRVHTINTHLRGNTEDTSDGMGYLDYNLRDPDTGAVPYITDLGQKREIMKQRGLTYLEDGEADKRKAEKRKHRTRKSVTLGGTK